MGHIKIHCACNEMVRIHKFRPNPQNPKRHSTKQIERLAEAISDHGWRVPIIVSKRSGLIVDGHARLKAAQILGLKQIPVDKQNFANEVQEKLCLIADCLVPRAGINP